MRVFVYPEKTYEELGAKRWVVEWHTVRKSALARIAAAEARGETDEVDPDADVIAHARAFPHRGKGLAVVFAKKMADRENSAYGSATVTAQVVDWYVEEDRIAEWTTAGEPLYVP